ncbi:hypothetical protein [Vibrio breoganii]|uniref:hypothetical protein n=1 Tax=Vibrio breoganii TaxID=553239 RepID=UPI0010565A4C|nr:hypothetical protein [Vibrio breoganii]
MAQRTGLEAMPKTTEELIEVLEVRKFANSAKGLYRLEGKIGSRYNYHVGHRYPASKGGALIAENLVVMPAWVNWKLGDEHGKGLEELDGFKVESTIRFNSLQGFKKFCLKYDMGELKAFVNSHTGSTEDFEREGLVGSEVLKRESERLRERPMGTNLQVRDYLATGSKFAELCGGLVEFEKKAGLEDEHCMYLKYLEELEVEMFGRDNINSGLGQSLSQSFSVDDIIDIHQKGEVMKELREMEEAGQLGTPKALQLADELCPLEIEENAMYYRVMEAVA